MSLTKNLPDNDDVDDLEPAGEPQVRLGNELVSDEINDIISRKPAWIIRHGATLVGTVALLLITCSWFVRYPDTLQTSMDIIARSSPKKVQAESGGKLQSILVKNGDLVSERQPLAYFQSTANHNDVFTLRKWIGKVEGMVSINNIKPLSALKLPQFASVGELQHEYVEFQTIYFETLETFEGGYYPKKINVLTKNINLLTEQILVAREQRSVKEQLLLLQINLNKEEKELMDLEKKVAGLKSNFYSSLLLFKNKIDGWIRRFVVLSPDRGKIQYITSLLENQYVSKGQDLFYVEADNAMFYGEIVMQQAGVGKISAGKIVIVQVESYPSPEFGHLFGKVSTISPPLAGDSLLIHVTLPNDRRTNYNKVLPLKNHMHAKAEIIIEERRLLQRLFSKIFG